MQIELLVDCPEFIPLLSEWHHAEWSYLRPGFTLEDRIARFETFHNRREPPVVFIACNGHQLLGSAMLVTSDMDTRPELSPWLAGVFTAPEHRGQGIASVLCRHVVHHATELGFTRLYLYTPSAANFYARLGWKIMEQTRYRNTDVTIMSHHVES